MTSPKFRIGIAILALALAYGAWRWAFPAQPFVSCPPAAVCRHVYDMAKILPPDDIPRFENYMSGIFRESDVDIRFAFVAGTGAKSLEEYAVGVVDELRIGGTTREERGVLLLYDVKEQRLKVEVGYGLEGFFPDVFVGYLVNDHARQFFASGDLSLGLRFLLRLLQHRIREAVLGDAFDPRVLKAISSAGHLSGGAGVSTGVALSRGSPTQTISPLSEEERGLYAARESPEATYEAYLGWLAQPKYDPDIDLFTAESRRFLRGVPLTPAFRQFILIGEYGKTFRIVQRGNIAVLYFTSTPFTSPHFFVNEGGRWRIDLVAEVRNTEELVGIHYTWNYRGRDDRYTKTFRDLLAEVKGYRRFREGDNRELPVRGAPALP